MRFGDTNLDLAEFLSPSRGFLPMARASQERGKSTPGRLGLTSQLLLGSGSVLHQHNRGYFVCSTMGTFVGLSCAVFSGPVHQSMSTWVRTDGSNQGQKGFISDFLPFAILLNYKGQGASDTWKSQGALLPLPPRQKICKDKCSCSLHASVYSAGQ